MNRLILLVFVLVSLFGCKNQAGDDAASTENETTEMTAGPASTDVTGNYTGVLPCADCKGIATELLLNADSTFYKKSDFLGKEKPLVIEERGTYTWNDSLKVIILDKVMGGNQYAVGNKTLTHLDMEGKVNSGEDADKFVLRKK
jgi:copper homeostasis protein (lipoprotein)